MTQKNGEKKLMSYIEAAEELEKSITSLQEEIQSKKLETQNNSKETQFDSLSIEERKEERKEEEFVLHPVEIRETYDSLGNVIVSEVVDLSSQLNSTRSLLSELDKEEKEESKVSLCLNKMCDEIEERLKQTNKNNLLEDVISFFLFFLFFLSFSFI